MRLTKRSFVKLCVPVRSRTNTTPKTNNNTNELQIKNYKTYKIYVKVWMRYSVDPYRRNSGQCAFVICTLSTARTVYRSRRRKIRLMKVNSKCRHLKKLTWKWTLRQVFIGVYRLEIANFLRSFSHVGDLWSVLFPVAPLPFSLVNSPPPFPWRPGTAGRRTGGRGGRAGGGILIWFPWFFFSNIKI
jgi:hypothetical protein